MESNMEIVKLQIEGMACGGCANTVSQALVALDGVVDAEVSHADGSASVRYDPAKLGPQKLADAVSAAGYPAKLQS